MCAKWNKEYENYISKLIEKLDSIETVSAVEKVSFGTLEYQYIDAVLQSALTFDTSLPEIERRSIVSKALSDAAQSGTFTAHSIIGAISRRENEYICRPKVRYILLSSLSIQSDFLPPACYIGNCYIRFVRSFPSHFDRSHALNRMQLYRMADIPADYLRVKVSVWSRSQVEAAETALDALDLLRGLWNLSLNLGAFGTISHGVKEPVNWLRLGPVHTLHLPSGEATNEWIWYQPDYRDLLLIRPIKINWEALKDEENKFRAKLKVHPYRKDVETSIKRYCAALDTNDLNSSFLRLWGVLEYLTGVASDRNKDIRKRVSFLYIDKPYHSLLMKHLLDYRNKNVHHGKDISAVEPLLFQLKEYVENFILFHLLNLYKFDSLQSAVELLDQPVDPKQLRRKLNLLRITQKIQALNG